MACYSEVHLQNVCFVVCSLVAECGEGNPTKCGETNAATVVRERGKISSAKNWKDNKEFKNNCID